MLEQEEGVRETKYPVLDCKQILLKLQELKVFVVYIATSILRNEVRSEEHTSELQSQR